MAESAESTAAAPAEGNPTQSQSTESTPTAPKETVTVVKAESSDAIILGVALLIVGVAAFYYLNKKMARDSADQFWEAEEDFHGQRLFGGDAWNDMKSRGFN